VGRVSLIVIVGELDFMRRNILIIDDEPSITDNIEYALGSEGFDCVSLHTGEEGMERLRRGGIDLVVLDIGLPDSNGFEVFAELRSFSRVPVIFLTARDSEIDRVAGLEMGADDYQTKPFSPRELVARIRAVLRRGRVASHGMDSGAVVSVGDFDLREEVGAVACRGVELSLTRQEYGILRLMILHPGKVFPRREIMNEIWESPDTSMERTVDTHIKTIRSKLRDAAPELPDPIATKRGFGYALYLEGTGGAVGGDE